MDYKKIKQSALPKYDGGVSPVKQGYYYKINGKNVTKAEYNAYKNEPGKMEGGGKTTNDPDPSGRKAATEKARSKNKRPTVLTEAQTKAIEKKPPFKKKKGQAIGGVSRSPLHWDWKDALDGAQTAIMGAGMIPGVGIVADAANTLISGGRAAYAKATGDDEGAKEHMINMGVNAGAMIPIVGQGVVAGKIAHGVGKQAAKQVMKKGAKGVAEHVVKKGAKNIVKTGTKGTLKSVDKLAANKNKNKINTTKKNVAENRSSTKPKKVA